MEQFHSDKLINSYTNAIAELMKKSTIISALVKDGAVYEIKYSCDDDVKIIQDMLEEYKMRHYYKLFGG